MGTGPIWSEQAPIYSGPINPYLIIVNLAETTGSADMPIIVVWSYAPFWPGGGVATSTKQLHCLGQAITNHAVSLGFDAAGFVLPEVTLFQVGVGVTSAAYSATQQDTRGFFMGIAGLHLSALVPAARQAGWRISKALPFLGTALNVVSTGQDLYSVITDYRSCMATSTD